MSDEDFLNAQCRVEAPSESGVYVYCADHHYFHFTHDSFTESCAAIEMFASIDEGKFVLKSQCRHGEKASSFVSGSGSLQCNECGFRAKVAGKIVDNCAYLDVWQLTDLNTGNTFGTWEALSCE